MGNAALLALAFLFFAPLSFIYGRSLAGRLGREARGRSMAAAALPKLVVPLLIGAALVLRLSGTDPAAFAGESATLRAGLGLLWNLGSIAALLFFVVVPFVLGRLFGVMAAMLGFFADVADDPLSFGASGFKSESLPRAVATNLAEERSMTEALTIAIDGPAAAGKGTLAKRLSAHYGLPYLDTGLLYRAVGKLAAEQGVDLDDAEATASIAETLDTSHLDDGALRGREAGELASRVAVHPAVRKALEAFQRAFAARPEGAVLDGRDIGTVICPQARVKIFVTASAEVRARRRTDELQAKGRAVDYERILEEVKERDARDAGRAVAPLKPATDARLLDTSEMDIEAAFQAACAIIDASPS